MKINIKNANTNKLHQELIDNNINPLHVECTSGIERQIKPDTWITFAEDTDMTAVQVIIDAHDPTPLPPLPTQDDYLIDLDYRLSMLELGL